MTNLNLLIEEIVFRGRPSIHDSGEGLFIGPDGLVGLDEGVAQRRSESQKPWAQGSFDVPSFGAARVISLSGWARAVSPEKLGWWKHRLTGLLADGHAGVLSVDHQGLQLTTSVRLAGTTRLVPMKRSRRRGDFQIQFWAANPRLFGETLVVGPGTTVAILHRGNFPATAVLTIAGTMPAGYTVLGPDGKVFTVTAAVVSGHPHTIEMSSGLLTVDGAYVYGAITAAQTWAVPPGALVTATLVPVSGSGTLTATVRDTYM